MQTFIYYNPDENYPPPEDLLSIADQLHIKVWDKIPPCSNYLQWSDGRLVLNILKVQNYNKINPIFFDLSKLWRRHLKKRNSIFKEPLARALGVKKSSLANINVWDITGGTLKDAILILSFGAKVTAFERSKKVNALILDALRIAATDRSLSHHLKERLKFYPMDVRNFGLKENERPEVIYLDPMYTPKIRKALPRKEMIIFREIVGDDLDADELFDWAMRNALNRVVVKRSIYASPLREDVTAVYKGRTTRYDMYSCL